MASIKYDVNKDWLIEEYHNKKRTPKDISADIGCSRRTLRDILIRLDIPLRNCRHIYTWNTHYFDEPNLDNSYWAGFMAADGNIRMNGHSFSIGLASKDDCILEELKNQLEYTGPIFRSEKYTSIGNLRGNSKYPTLTKFSMLTIHGATNATLKLRENWNITPRKTFTLEPPINLSLENNIAYIIGYFDGDGTWQNRLDKMYNRQRHLWRVIGRLNMMEWMSDCLFKYTNLLKNPYSCKRSDIYALDYCDSKAIKMRELLLNIPLKFRLARKWNNI